MKNKLISLPRMLKQTIIFMIDAVSIVFSVWLVASFHFHEFSNQVYHQHLIYLFTLTIALFIFLKMGLYRTVFRHAGQHTFLMIIKAVFLFGLVFLVAIIFFNYFVINKNGSYVPLSMVILQSIIMMGSIILGRLFITIWFLKDYSKSTNGKQGILIYGAEFYGEEIGRLLEKSGQYYLVGYVDDDPQFRNRTVNGFNIYGIDKVSELINEQGVTDILLSIPATQQSRRNRILNDLRGLNVHVRSLPSISDFAKREITVSDIQELDVNDLLGRDLVSPNKVLFEKNIKNKVVMVTGAGGSIGAELTRQILLSHPKTLILLEQSEFALYSVEEELKKKIKVEGLNIELISLLGTVQKSDFINKIFSTWKINTVYHAAAYKHVPIVERNIIEGILNNVWGTLNIVHAAIEFGVDDFVLISTDKAVRPTNVMGASKRLAELVVQALANKGPICTQLSIVRFGNVLGSSGSVVPLFRSQINLGGPVTITHPDVTRYFMTVEEAAQLVIQAGAISSINAAECQGAVFILDMGQPVKILNLAHRMIELSGFSIKNEKNPTGKIDVEVIGLRPGEKLYEELFIGNNPTPTEHPKIMKAQENFILWADLEKELIVLRELLEEGNATSIFGSFKNLVTGFMPDAEIVDWFTLNNIDSKFS